MSSRERMILRFVLWLVNTYLQNRYRLMSPEDLNQVVNNYLTDLQKIGVRLVLNDQEANSNDKVTANDPAVFQEAVSTRQSDSVPPSSAQV